MAENFRVEIDAQGVALITLDVAGEPVNTLSLETGKEFLGIVERLLADSKVKAAVLASGKKDNFVAGAKLEMIQSVKSANEAEQLSREGQRGFDELERSSKPVVAAIDGSCLGGGLEWAMACQYRIATSNPKTALGLPEVMLGLIPGSGGTQRLPRLVGLAEGLKLILTGQQLKAKKALSLGLVDEVVPPSILVEVAKKRALELASGALKPVRGGRKPSKKLSTKELTAVLQHAALEDNRLGQEVVFRQAKNSTLKKTHGHYPAPLKAIEAVREGVIHGHEAGQAAEARAFGELVVSQSSRRLVEIFFAQTALKKETHVPAEVKPRDVTRLGVLGGGLMGGGIAYTWANAGLPVRLKDKDDAGVARAFAHVRGLFDERTRRRSLSPLERDAKMALFSATTDYSGFARCELLIEAVFEDLKLKQSVLKDVEANCPRDTVFASNTSTLPIGRIAEASAHPETVVGMHFFSPVNKMPLLEVIVHPKTAPQTTATAVAAGKRMGKTVIVVNDGVGFYTTRILAPYINEAAYLLAEGASIEAIDRALVDFGFPVGPLALTDEVGIDVGAKVAKIVGEAFGERIAAPKAIDKLIADGRLGRKNKKGFYTYDGKKKEPDPSIYALLPGKPERRSFDAKEIAERCVLQMVNEAALCLGEGVLRTPRDGDVGAVFGLGFPPFLGGPFRYADSVGLKTLVDKLERLAGAHGKRFAPAPVLVERARGGKKFYA